MKSETLQHIWYDSGTSRYHLLPVLKTLSLPYRSAVGLKNGLYDRGMKRTVKLPCPVISIGNLTVGGTGKTPMVITLAKLLLDRKRHPAVLSRGYGGSSGVDACIVSDGYKMMKGFRETGEEALLIAESLPGVPVITGADRVKTGSAALRHFSPDVLILDDGFQHRRLQRDLDIVLVDADRPLGNGWLLPAGPLREPIASLQRAHVVIRTGPGQVAGENSNGSEAIFRKAGFTGTVLRGVHKPRTLVHGPGKEIFPLDAIRGEKVAVFAGIGRPEHFRKTIAELGAEITTLIPYPDHHIYREEDLKKIEESRLHSGALWIVTTQKDEVKLRGFETFLQRILVLNIEMDLIPDSNILEHRVLLALH
jgi:tetraacyldisaccharide 4'-kinase